MYKRKYYSWIRKYPNRSVDSNRKLSNNLKITSNYISTNIISGELIYSVIHTYKHRNYITANVTFGRFCTISEVGIYQVLRYTHKL